MIRSMSIRTVARFATRWLVVFMAMTFVVFVVYGLLAHAFRTAVVESPRVQSWLRRGFAAAFAGLGAQLALSER